MNRTIRMAILFKFLVPRYVSVDELFSHLNHEMNQMNRMIPDSISFHLILPTLTFPQNTLLTNDTLSTRYTHHMLHAAYNTHRK